MTVYLPRDKNSNICRIYHLSDIHIYCDKRHDEYKNIFQDFLSQIKPDNSVVVITGNILNSKNRITPNEIILARNFIFNISQKCPVIIIKGNNDNHENIKALLSSGKIQLNNIHYLVNDGCYILQNILFTYTTSGKLPVTTDKHEYNIGLYHGVVEKCILYNGKHASSKKIKLSTFKNCDYVLLGGINKTQFIDTNKKIVYAGSMIQNDYSEDWNDHGYVLLDLEKNKITHIPIYNTYRFVILKIIDGNLMTPMENLPNNLYIKWDITESGSGMESIINEIQNNIRRKYNVEEELYVHNSFTPSISVAEDNKYIFDLSIEKQKEYALLWNKSEGKFLEEDEQKEIGILIDKYNNKIKSKDLPYIQWKLLDIEFENILCYSKKQKVDFNNLQGVNGIIAENNAGKSALFDILVFSLFGKSTRTDTYSYNDLVYTSDNEEKRNIICILRLQDIITNDIYTIKREMNGKTIIVTIEKNGLIIQNGSTRDGNSYIVSLLGTYDDFMTMTFMAQNNFHNFLMMTGKTQKEFTTRVFQLELYDKIHKNSKLDLKKLKNTLQSLEEKIKTINIEDTKENIKNISEKLLLYKNEKNDIIKQTNETKKEKEKLIPTIEPLIQEKFSETLEELQNLEINNVNNLNDIKKTFIKDWDNDEIEKSTIEKEIHSLIKKVIDNESFKEKWKEICKIFNTLKEARGKKVKEESLKECSYEKSTKQIIKNIKLAEDFINENESTTNINEENIDIIKEEIFELHNNKPSIPVFINLEKVKDKFTIKNNILENLDITLKNQTISINNLKKELKKYNDISDNILINSKDIEENIHKNKEKERQNKTKLNNITEKLTHISIIKKQLELYEYDPKCKYCCNNEFVIDAKKKIKDEDELLLSQNKITKEIEEIEENIKNQKNKKIKFELIHKIEEHDKNISNIQNAIDEFHTLQKIKDELIIFDKKLEDKNNTLKKMKKIIKIHKSIANVKEYLVILKELQKKYNKIYVKNIEDTKYNNIIDEKKQFLYNRLDDIKKYIHKKNTIQNLINTIDTIKNNIKIKKQNIKLIEKNNITKKTLTLLTDIIENNNTKIINIIQKETELHYNLKKYKDNLLKYDENKDKYDEITKKSIILQSFIEMTHHNGIPSYLLKKVTTLLQNNVNIILSEYSTMKVCIKNEAKETSIKIVNNKYKNGLNAKMLCGSEKFLVELAFRVAFQMLSNISKPNFFICDEGWSCLDEKTRSNLDLILKTLLGYNDYILTVSHINDVKKWMNNHIKIIVDENGCRHITNKTS